MKNGDAVLCYVEGCWAWFTTKSLSEQWGDDWNDAPYEHNAGTPYAWRKDSGEPHYDLVRVGWDGPWEVPSSGRFNSCFSVECINAQETPWLRPMNFTEARTFIYAGTTLAEFSRILAAEGGEVYFRRLGPKES